MENGEWKITVRVFRSPFLFIGCYFMAYIYIICTIYAVGCAKIKSAINYNSQVLGVITRKRVARPCLSRLRRVNRMCSSNVSDTANMSGHGSTLCSPTVEKILCRSPYFEAVTCRQSAPDSPRERGDSQEGGNRRCLPSCAPARRQRTPR